MRNRILATTLLTPLLPFAASPAAGHEFWVQPQTFHPAVGQPLAVELRVGDDLHGISVARRDRHTVRFELVHEVAVPIAGREGGRPAGFLRVDQPGLAVIGYESRHSQLEIDADRFEEYLVDKGLEAVVEARASAGDSRRQGRERYARCAKALLAVGNAQGSDRRLGLTLELVAEDNPYLASRGQDLRFQLLYRGTPLPGALVKAWQAGTDAARGARTDAAGRVSMRLDGPGMWLLSTVHMVPTASWPDADWESTWASLTFERRGAME